MKIIFYILTVLLGAYGLMGFLRFGELLLLGRLAFVQGVIGIVSVVLAYACLKKARSSV